MATGALVAHGYHLFTQIYSAQPPLFPLLLAGFDRLFGSVVTAARLLVLCSGLITLAGVAAVSGLSRGRVAGGVAALLLAASPEFLVYSHAVEEEMLMNALATGSLALALLWYRRRGPEIAAASGLVFGLAVVTKFYALALLAPMAVLLAIVLRDGRATRSHGGSAASPSSFAPGHLAWDAGAWVIGAVLPVALSLAVFGRAEWKQMVGDRVTASRQFPGAQSLSSNIHMIVTFLDTDVGLCVLAIVGGLLLLTANWRLALVLGTWALGLAAVLARYHPLMGHHPVVLLPPLAALAGIAVSYVPSAAASWRGNRDTRRQPGARSGLHRAIAVAVCVLYLGFLPRLVIADVKILVPAGYDERATAAQIVRAHTPPGGFVAAGDAWIAVDADRLSVPDLVDSSYVRIETGRLTAQEAIRATARYRAAAVALWPRFRVLTAYADWVRAHYHIAWRECASFRDCNAVYVR